MNEKDAALGGAAAVSAVPGRVRVIDHGHEHVHEHLQGTSEASRVYSNLGVTFIGEAGSIPTVQIEALDHLLPGRSDWVLRNQPDTGSSANRALIIRFDRPLKKVGFTLGNGTASTLAEISAFTAKGEFLGKVQHLGVETTRGINVHQTGPFVGLETSHPAGISSVVLDYGRKAANSNSILVRPRACLLLDHDSFKRVAAVMASPLVMLPLNRIFRSSRKPFFKSCVPMDR